MATNDTCCTIQPYFKVHSGKLTEFKALCERFVERTRNEEGCLYYGWSFDGDQVHCREGYRDAAATVAHIENVGPLVAEAVKIADVVRFELHGPAAELDKLRGPFAAMSPQYFTLESGFRR
jgi:quinol monooxygenase YgiN